MHELIDLTDVTTPYPNGHLNGHTDLQKQQPVLTVTGTSHIDPAWMWDTPNGLGAFRATARSIVDRAKEFPEATFALSSAQQFQHLEQTAPGTFEEITELVKQGRLEPVGGMWVEPDEYMLSGPGFERQLLEGQEYFAKKFGRISTTAWSVDHWGGRAHNQPSLYAKAGITGLLYKRPEDHQVILPRTFRWQNNTDEIIVYHLHEYGTWRKGLPRHMRRVVRDMRKPHVFGLGLYGAGNHGGGPMKENIEQINEYIDNPDTLLPTQQAGQNHGPIVIRHGLPEQFFANVSGIADQLPVVQGDIPSTSQGHYGSHSGVKAEIRRAEHALYTAEAASTAADIMEPRSERKYYPSVDLKNGWKKVLESHFHDIAAGTCIPDVYAQVLPALGGTRADVDKKTAIAMQRIANEIEIPVVEGQERTTFPIVVFNFNGHEIEQFIEENTVDPEMHFETGDITQSHMLVDEEGNEVEFQRMIVDTAPYPRVGFIAKVKPGYRVYRMVPKPEDYEEKQIEGVTVENQTLENEAYQLEIDSETGAIKRFFDKDHNLDVTKGLAALPQIFEDPANAWGQEEYTKPVEGARYVPTSIATRHDGPIKSSIIVEYTLEKDGQQTKTTLSQEFTMYKGQPQIDVKVRSLLMEPQVAVKLAFPVAVKTYPEAVYDIPYATSMRPIAAKESPGQNWVDLSGESDYNSNGERIPHGLTISSDAKFSYSSAYDPDGTKTTTMNMLISRSGTYTTLPENEEEAAFQRYLDVGEAQEFSYSLRPHIGDWQEGEANKAGIETNRPLRSMPEAPHPGTEPMQKTFVCIDRPNIELGEMKKAEDGKGYIVRLNEKFKQTERNVPVTFFGRQFTVDFRPEDIKTIYIPDNPNLPILETDVLERLLT